MIDKIKNNCCGCSACANKCPYDAIQMVRNNEGFYYPKINAELCSKCNICESVCPVLTGSDKNNAVIFPEEAYGAVVKDKKLQYESSSGGVFSLLAENILTDGGVVYGAAFSDDFGSVKHISISDVSDLYKLRGSKYIQSENGNSFSDIKNKLEQGQKVLFSGTPCQVGGLKAFLHKEYDNLFCVDVICHGTPPAALWQKYLDHIEQRYDGKTISVNFRHKERGWKEFGLDLEKENIRYYRSMKEDPYIRMFLKNYCLRESCYQCEIKKSGYVSDITIGDFWGVDRVVPEIANDMGVSLVILHTDKGKRIFEEVLPLLKSIKVDKDEAVSHNSAYFKSVIRPVERNYFFKDMNSLSWDELEKKYLSEKMDVKIRKKIKAILRKLNIYRGGVENKFSYGVLIVIKHGF